MKPLKKLLILLKNKLQKPQTKCRRCNGTGLTVDINYSTNTANYKSKKCDKCDGIGVLNE